MPHHESGLLALKSTDPKLLDQAIGAALKHEKEHRVELVRVDQGRGVLACFGSVLGKGHRHVEMDFFTDEKALGALAKRLKQPLWAGFAVGGYTNSQQARHFGPDGKLRWRSHWDFNLDAKAAAAVADPFTLPEQRTALLREARASNGYGRIGAELGFDYYNLLDVEAGDPLFARDKRRYGPKKMAEHAKWLKSKFVPPEGDSGDSSEPPPTSKKLVYRVLAKRPDSEGLATALAGLLAHHRAGPKDLSFDLASSKEATWLQVSGKAVERFSPLLVSGPFVQLLSTMGQASLMAWGSDGRGAFTVRAGVGGGGGDLLAFLRAQREPPPLAKLKFKPLAAKPTAKRRKQLDALRKELRRAAEEAEDW